MAPYTSRGPPFLYAKAGRQAMVARISFSLRLWRTGSLRVWRTLVKLRSPMMRRRRVSSGAFPLQIKGGKTVGFSPVASGVGMCQPAVAAIFWRRKFPGISHLLKPGRRQPLLCWIGRFLTSPRRLSFLWTQGTDPSSWMRKK